MSETPESCTSSSGGVIRRETVHSTVVRGLEAGPTTAPDQAGPAAEQNEGPDETRR